MRDSKRDTEVKNRLLDSGRRRGWDDLREWRGDLQQEYWNWLLFRSPGDLPGPGIKSRSPALQADL